MLLRQASLLNSKMLTFYAQIAAAERAPLVPSIVQQLDPFEGGLCLHSLGSRDLRIIFRAILAHPKDLHRLTIEDCNLSSLGVALSNAICSATELETLILDRCQFAVNALYTQVLANLYLTKVKALSVINCKLTDSQLISFARTLDNLPYLTELSLSHNHIKDSTVAQLFKALQSYSLDVLDLRFCGLGFQSAKIILSFLDRYPENIGTLLLDYNNFSANLQSRLLRRCSDGSPRSLKGSQGSGHSGGSSSRPLSRSSSRSPQERRSTLSTRTTVCTKISGFQDDTLQDAESNMLTETPLNTDSDTHMYMKSFNLTGIPSSIQIEGGEQDLVIQPTEDISELASDNLSNVDSPSLPMPRTIQQCTNTAELTTFLNTHLDGQGNPLNVDFSTFKWSFSHILSDFQAIISSCQKRKEKLGKADLRKMLDILRILYDGSATYNTLLTLDMTYKLKCAEKRSDAYVEYQEKKAGLLLQSSSLEQIATSNQNEMQLLVNQIADLQKHIDSVSIQLDTNNLDEEANSLEQKISVTKDRNAELSDQIKEVQQIYEELLANEYTQQSAAANYVDNLRKEFPVYADAREAYCKYLYGLIEELLERVRNHKNELKGLLDAIRVRSI